MVCENLIIENDGRVSKCKITGYLRKSEKTIQYCTEFESYCGLRSGLVKLEPNEYTYGFVKDDVAIPNMVFVNNKGTKFPINDKGEVMCLICGTEYRIISFQYGIFCKRCMKRIH